MINRRTAAIISMFFLISSFAHASAEIHKFPKMKSQHELESQDGPSLSEFFGDFHYGLAYQRATSGFGFIDKTGRFVIPPQFERVTEFEGGWASAQRASDHQSGILDTSGNWVIPPDYLWVSTPSEGLAWALYPSGKIGLIGMTGKSIVPPTFNSTRGFSEGVALVYIQDTPAFLDHTGKVILKLPYMISDTFKDGLARFSKDGKAIGYHNHAGEVVIPEIYDRAEPFHEGLARVLVRGKGAGFIDQLGREIIPFKFDFVDDFSEDLAVAKKDGKEGYIDRSGNFAIQAVYDSADRFTQDGLAAVKIQGKIGFIDRSGNTVIPPQFDETSRFSEGLAVVRKDSSVFYIDQSGKTVIRVH